MRTLLVRTTASVELTPAGRDFLVDARRLVALHEAVLTRLNGESEPGRVRIGVMEDYGTKRLPPIAADVATRFPNVELYVEVGLTAPMLKRLGADFDLVIAMHSCGGSQGELIQIEQPVWVASQEAIPPHQAVLPFALSTTDCLFRQWACEALQAAGVPWRLAYTSASQAAVEALVSEGLALSVMKGSMVPDEFQNVGDVYQLPPLPQAEIRLHRSPALKGIGNLVADRLRDRLRPARLRA